MRGLWGIGTEPFLHASYGHLLSNTIPFILIGWVVLLSGVRTWLTVTLIVMVGGGLLTWLVAPHGIVLGANGLIFGWLGYLLARAYFSRKLKWIVVAVAGAVLLRHAAGQPAALVRRQLGVAGQRVRLRGRDRRRGAAAPAPAQAG